ncbi:MAG: NADAR family protein [Chlamydiales bacterium]|nr:NADAR family protein [Chlamydiales bacterium]
MASETTPSIIRAIQKHATTGTPIEAIFLPSKDRGVTRYALVYNERTREWSSRIISKIDSSIAELAIEALTQLPPVPKEMFGPEPEGTETLNGFREVLKNLNIIRSSVDVSRADSKAASTTEAEGAGVISFSSRSVSSEKTLSNFYPTLLYMPSLAEKLESLGVGPHICDLFTQVFPSVENIYQLFKAAYLGILDCPENFAFAVSNKIWLSPPQDLKKWVNKREASADPKREVNWEKSKVSLMSRLVKAKLRFNPVVASYLKSTSGQALEENTSSVYWGTGADGRGHNHLGKIYERLRAESEESKDCS